MLATIALTISLIANTPRAIPVIKSMSKHTMCFIKTGKKCPKIVVPQWIIIEEPVIIPENTYDEYQEIL